MKRVFLFHLINIHINTKHLLMGRKVQSICKWHRKYDFVGFNFKLLCGKSEYGVKFKVLEGKGLQKIIFDAILAKVE